MTALQSLGKRSKTKQVININLKDIQDIKFPNESIPSGQALVIVFKPSGFTDIGILENSILPKLQPLKQLVESEKLWTEINTGKLIRNLQRRILNSQVKEFQPRNFNIFRKIYKKLTPSIDKDDGYKEPFFELRKLILEAAVKITDPKENWFPSRWVIERLKGGLTLNSYKSFFFPRKWTNHFFMDDIEECKIIPRKIWYDSRIKLAYLFYNKQRENHLLEGGLSIGWSLDSSIENGFKGIKPFGKSGKIAFLKREWLEKTTLENLTNLEDYLVNFKPGLIIKIMMTMLLKSDQQEKIQENAPETTVIKMTRKQRNLLKDLFKLPEKLKGPIIDKIKNLIKNKANCEFHGREDQETWDIVLHPGNITHKYEEKGDPRWIPPRN